MINRRVNFLLEPYLIRNFEESDISEMYLSWLNNKDHVKFSSQKLQSHSQESALRYLAKFKNSENLFLSISWKSTPIGTSTFYFSPNSSSLDIGILIDPKFAGLGHGKKIWGSLLEIAKSFPEVKTITAGTHVENQAMLKIFASHGMREHVNRLAGLPNHRYFTLEI